jgi:hypothetical protein
LYSLHKFDLFCLFGKICSYLSLFVHKVGMPKQFNVVRSTKSKFRRQEIKTHQKQRRLLLYIGLGIIGIAALALMGFLVVKNNLPGQGEAVAVMASAAHVPDGTDPGPYNSDPPTSGRHYATNLKAGFYDSAAAANVPKFQDGYLVHSLEHGYVIFWYNCKLMDNTACTNLTGQLRQMIVQEKNYKVIAFPRDSLDTPVIATTWGRILRFKQFDLQQAYAFIKANRNKAPEPFAN